ncbi:MAG: hotdog domain-containing protein [Cytophagales bacterium]|nr:hotdog domain-containing protein [Cytophagales bacterium]
MNKDLTNVHQILHWVQEGKTRELEALFNQSPQLRLVGATIDISDMKHPVVTIEKVEALHLGGIGGRAVNGGVVSMLVDLAIGLLGISYYGEGLTATHNLSIHFVRPLIATSVIFEAAETQVIGNRIFGNVRVMNEKREVCAYASGVLVKAIKS